MKKYIAGLTLGLLLLAPAAKANEDLIEVPLVDENAAVETLDADQLELEAADAFDHHHGHPPVRPGRGRFVCTARNIRGNVFYGQARNQVRAQNRAIQSCQDSRSLRCVLQGCTFQF